MAALMRDWITDVQRLRDDEQAALAETLADLHARFEQIHPFLDGNGRAGRLVLNLVLVRLGYPPAVVEKNNRSRYLAALRHADQDDRGPLGELMARAVLDNLYQFVVPAVAGPARLVPLPALATETSRRMPCASPRTAAASRPPRPPTARGAARRPGSTSTSHRATGGNRA